MITPSFSLTATERILPRMALDFTTATLDPRVTFTRTGNTATVINSSGVIAAINADLPRFDYDPTTLACKGLLIEEARTNLLLNSLLNGTNLSTQLVTTTAVSQTLSFYGTGQIVLTGTSSATVVGTGAYPTRTTLTFTPTVGALTLTVTGTVQYAQLEVGAFATSFIPTAASQVTRTADLASMTGTNFTDWYSATRGSFVCKFDTYGTVGGGTGRGLLLDSAATTLWPMYRHSTGPAAIFDGTTLALSSSSIPSFPTVSKVAIRYGSSEQAVSLNGSTRVTSTSAGFALTGIKIGGSQGSILPLAGRIQNIFYYLVKFTDSEMRAFTT
jgi:hypothetical protein